MSKTVELQERFVQEQPGAKVTLYRVNGVYQRLVVEIGQEAWCIYSEKVSIFLDAVAAIVKEAEESNEK